MRYSSEDATRTVEQNVNLNKDNTSGTLLKYLLYCSLAFVVYVIRILHVY